jgi:solute carrier family 26 (sodium-independent sulfate anion transporter), member 11
VIPQALAYATVAGLPPQVNYMMNISSIKNSMKCLRFFQYGLYSAFIGCFVYVFLGSTVAVTIGPTALLSLLCYDAVISLGPGAAVLLAFLSGCLDLAMGLLNLGKSFTQLRSHWQ